ncbi:MAG: 6-pyruvoyl-tetrahydropterin synthase-related protein [Candidatus Xenobia bacterium]
MDGESRATTMRRAVQLALLGLFLLFAAPAGAAEIQLEMVASVKVQGNNATSNWHVTNRGHDTALHVALVAELLGQSLRSDLTDHLGPGQSSDTTLHFRLPTGGKGTWPIRALVTYDDSTGAHLSSPILVRLRTATAPESDLKLSVQHVPGLLLVSIDGRQAGRQTVQVTPLVANELLVQPASQLVRLGPNGEGRARFQLINAGAPVGSTYGVFVAAEYDRDGIHYLTTADDLIPVQQATGSTISDPSATSLWSLAVVAVLALALLSLLQTWRDGSASTRLPLWIFDGLALLLIECFILSRISPESILLNTTATGGDMASHVYTAWYMKHVMLPDGRVSSWTPGNYAGFPMLQAYFPLTFVLMTWLSVVMPLNVAFKLVSIAGVLLLPVGAYCLLRQLRVPFPGPGLGAVFMVPFLFNCGQTMWGGNLLSTLAGESSYELSLALSLVFLGCLYRGCLENRGIVVNAVLVFLVGFSHGYTLLFVEAMSLYLLLTPNEFLRRLEYLFKVYALGFCLLAFWLVPLLAFTWETVPFDLVWTIRSISEAAPALLVPFLGIGLLATLGLLIGKRRLPELGLLWFGVLVAGVLFVLAPRIGVVDVRNVPFAQLLLCLMAAIGIAEAVGAVHRMRMDWIVLSLLTVGTLAWVSPTTRDVTSWCRWNFEGCELKPAWALLHAINESLRGSFQDPRVVFEHNEHNDVFGTTRAFESLPLFAHRATLEGVYMQASLSSPFVFYIQSLVSEQQSCPFPEYICSHLDYGRARPRLHLFNVRDIILRTPAAHADISRNPAYRFKARFGTYELWQVADGDNHYVEPLHFQPVAWHGTDFKLAAYQWFRRDDLLERPIVYIPPQGVSPCPVTVSSLDQIPSIPIDTSGCEVHEEIRDAEIRIHTNWIGKPLLIKMSYHPDWHVEGAGCIYLISPSFMLIYPEQPDVRLFYGPGRPDQFGAVLTVLGLVILLASAFRLRLPSLADHVRWEPRPQLMGIVVGAVLLGTVVACVQVYMHEPSRLFLKAIVLKDRACYKEARANFEAVRAAMPTSAMGADSSYYIAITYDNEHRNADALKAFTYVLKAYPDSNWVEEVKYHIGLCLVRLGQRHEGLREFSGIVQQYPRTRWAELASDRIKEIQP